ncbi:sugar phosphate isomerase/epimerase [Halobacillus salinarum]|uniref:Sugar phosphate isomerase/epimerase n=1 Tax=Halobacillus salinarum TaxID=2932257 RepID=A0ABY4EI74_9BACI|nr:sugar phosphate isomerase/epimerase family protein [Halobacillus salinarum]UOQ44181.1 sugar phosphate isomerase/epimerase [Halobacillus salinarum]
MKFSVFTVMAPDTTPEELVRILNETGYDGVEWRFKETPEAMKQEEPSFWRNNLCTLAPDATEEELTALKKLTNQHGIEVTSVTPYLTAGDLVSTEHVLQVAQKLGASAIRLGVPKYDRSQNYNDLYKTAVDYLHEVEPMCQQYGIKGLVETHHLTIAPSAGLAHRLVNGFNPDHIGVLYDPGNMVHEGYENYRMGMELLGDYLGHVHVKNASWHEADKHPDGTVDWEARWTLLEKGIVDWKQVLADLRSVGYDGTIGIEDFSGELSTRDSLAHHMSSLKQLLAEVYSVQS